MRSPSRWVRAAALALALLAALPALAACRPTTAPGRGSTTSDDGSNHRTMFVEDSTGAGWPVTRAVVEWNKSPAVDVRYGACRAHARCAKVHEGELPDDQVGLTRQRQRGGRVYADVTVNSNAAKLLSPSKRLAALERLATVIHELGHALGLEHVNKFGQTIMYPDLSEQGPYVPTKLDFATLAKLYKGVPP